MSRPTVEEFEKNLRLLCDAVSEVGADGWCDDDTDDAKRRANTRFRNCLALFRRALGETK